MSVADTIFICEGAGCLLPKDSQEPFDGFPSFRDLTCLPDYTEVAQRRSRDTEEHQLWTVFQGFNNDPSFDPKTNKFGTPQPVRMYESPQQYGVCNGHRFPLGRGGDPGRLSEPPNRPEWMHSYPEAVRDPNGKLCSFMLHEDCESLEYCEEKLSDFMETGGGVRINSGVREQYPCLPYNHSKEWCHIRPPPDFGKTFKVVPSDDGEYNPIIIRCVWNPHPLYNR